MAHFKPHTPVEYTHRHLLMELPLLDEEFDGEVDFSDSHEATLEITNQFDTHSKH